MKKLHSKPRATQNQPRKKKKRGVITPPKLKFVLPNLNSSNTQLLSTTPVQPLSKAVVAHCRAISTTAPILLKHTPVNSIYKGRCCHLNVKHCISEHGGEMVFGWIIWESFLFVEAEFAPVWRPADSEELIDITPRPDGEEEILFLPDGRRRIARDPQTGCDLLWSNRTNLFFMPFTNDAAERRAVKDQSGHDRLRPVARLRRPQPR